MTLTEFLLARIAEDENRERLALANLPIGITVPDGAYTRVLAECEAKRRIVQDIIDNDYYPAAMVTDGLSARVLEYLAAVYADHPDFDEAWRD